MASEAIIPCRKGGSAALVSDHQLSEIRSGSGTGSVIGAAIHDRDGHLTRLCQGTSATKSATTCTSSGTGAYALQMQWDALDRLNTVTRTGTGAVTEHYTYDDSGRRIQKTSAGNTTHYLYDGNAIHAEWVGAMAGAPSAAYTHGAGIDSPVLRLTGSTNSPAATQTAYLQDGLGSVVGTMTTAGTLTANQRFDAWGNKGASSGTVPTFGYAGREPDATGLTYYRARYYHPGIGRFMSRDPAGMVDAVSPYAYVGNNPVGYVDPYGKALETAWDAFNVGLGSVSLVNNVRERNWGWAALDAVGLVYDGAATLVPFLPAGASAGLKAYRAGNTVVDSIQVGSDVAQVARYSDDVARAADRTANAAQEGSRVHREVGDAIDGSNTISSSANNFFGGANRATGPQPDMSWSNADGVWLDLTTPGQWQRHVDRYGSQFGEGIPLLYQRGDGLVNANRLYSGAGTGLTGMRQGLNYLDNPYSGADTGGNNPRRAK